MEERKSDTIVEISKLKKSYITPSEKLDVLKGIDLTITRGEFIGIWGPSGSGKSTLLNIIGLLESFEEGTYDIAKINAQDLSGRQAQQIRLEKIGFIFQTFNLIQTLTTAQNIELPMQLMHRSQADQRKKSMELLEEFGIASKAHKFPHQLSIGEQQRVAIARALVNDPVLILCDEPTGNLDQKNAEIITSHLRKLRKFNTSIILVSHNEKLLSITDKNYELNDGKLILMG
jgi:putative ABC transport system ATP-binding protein